MQDKADKDKTSPPKLRSPEGVAHKPGPTTTAAAVSMIASAALKCMSSAAAFLPGGATDTPPASIPAPSIKMKAAKWDFKRFRFTSKEEVLTESDREDKCKAGRQSAADAKVHGKIANNIVGSASQPDGERQAGRWIVLSLANIISSGLKEP